jgi:hypothetical protein
MRAEQTVRARWRRRFSRGRREPSPSELENRSWRRAAVVETPAGRQLEELASGLHQHEEMRYWQANLLFERVSEQAGHPV